MEIEHLVSTLALYGFVVTTFGFDGATENRSAILQMLHLTLKGVFPDLFREVDEMMAEENASNNGDAEFDVAEPAAPAAAAAAGLDDISLSDSDDDSNVAFSGKSDSNSSLANFKKYGEDELPWDLKVAMKHPTVDGVLIFAGADLGHAVKKNRNTVEKSGMKNSKRELILDGQPMSLRMLQDVHELTPDIKDETAVMLFRKLLREVFELNSSTRLRTPLAMRVYSQTMLECIGYYLGKNTKASAETYGPIIEYISQMDRFIDIVNGNSDKGCELINSANHRHVFELLDFIKFITRWKNQTGKNKHQFLPNSTFQDTVWTATGLIGVARKQLRGGHTMVQRRHGSDVCEESFCYKRDKNANADALNTNHIMARNSHSGLTNLAASRKSNFGKRKTFYGFELDFGKIKRLRVNKSKGSGAIHR